MPRKPRREADPDAALITLSKPEKTSQRSFWRKFGPLLSDSVNFTAPIPALRLFLAVAPSIPKTEYKRIEARFKALMKGSELCLDIGATEAHQTKFGVRSASPATSTSGQKQTTISAAAAVKRSSMTPIGEVASEVMRKIPRRQDPDHTHKNGRKAPALIEKRRRPHVLRK